MPGREQPNPGRQRSWVTGVEVNPSLRAVIVLPAIAGAARP